MRILLRERECERASKRERYIYAEDHKWYSASHWACVIVLVHNIITKPTTCWHSRCVHHARYERYVLLCIFERYVLLYISMTPTMTMMTTTMTTIIDIWNAFRWSLWTRVRTVFSALLFRCSLKLNRINTLDHNTVDHTSISSLFLSLRHVESCPSDHLEKFFFTRLEMKQILSLMQHRIEKLSFLPFEFGF